ncbi:hypothetical protein D3C81_1469010 [compost metagenome]
MGLAGVGVVRALQAVLAQAVQVRARTGKDQRGFATSRITDHAHLAFVQIRPDQCIIADGGDCGADLQRPTIQVAQGAQTTVVAGVVPRVHYRHHHEASPRQRGCQVVQRQWAAGIAVGQDQ